MMHTFFDVIDKLLTKKSEHLVQGVPHKHKKVYWEILLKTSKKNFLEERELLFARKSWQNLNGIWTASSFGENNSFLRSRYPITNTPSFFRALFFIKTWLVSFYFNFVITFLHQKRCMNKHPKQTSLEFIESLYLQTLWEASGPQIELYKNRIIIIYMKYKREYTRHGVFEHIPVNPKQIWS